MKKQLSVLLTALVCFFFFSCKKEIGNDSLSSPEALAGEANKVRGKDGKGVPFKASYTTTFMTIQPPPMFIQKVTGTGIASHLGESTFEAISRVTVSGQPPFTVTGQRTITAANGDQIFTTFSGTSTPMGPGINSTRLHDVVTGGTGRFKNASGSFEAVALANQQTATFTADFDGYINY